MINNLWRCRYIFSASLMFAAIPICGWSEQLPEYIARVTDDFNGDISYIHRSINTKLERLNNLWTLKEGGTIKIRVIPKIQVVKDETKLTILFTCVMSDASDGRVRHANTLELREFQYKIGDELISHKFKRLNLTQGISESDGILAVYFIEPRIEIQGNGVSGNHVNIVFSDRLAAETLEKWASVPNEQPLTFRLVLDTGNATFDLSVERSRQPCKEFSEWAKEYFQQEGIVWPTLAPK